MDVHRGRGIGELGLLPQPVDLRWIFLLLNVSLAVSREDQLKEKGFVVLVRVGHRAEAVKVFLQVGGGESEQTFLHCVRNGDSLNHSQVRYVSCSTTTAELYQFS